MTNRLRSVSSRGRSHRGALAPRSWFAVSRQLGAIRRCVLIVAPLAAAGCHPPQVDPVSTIVERQNRVLMELPTCRLGELVPFGPPVEAEQVVSMLPVERLMLADARAIAVRANPDIHAAQARLHAATARIDEAMARFRPTASVSQNDARTFQIPASRNRLSSLLQPAAVPSDTIETGNPAVTALLNAIRRPLFGASARPSANTNAFSEHSTAFTVAWVAFDGYVREAQLLGAEHVRRASADALRDVERLVVQAVDTAYHQVQLAEERLRIAHADEVFSLEQLEETGKLQRAHRASQSDVNNFRVRALAAAANVTAATGQRDLGRVLLAELMGLPAGELPAALALSPLAEETEAELATPDVHAWVERALEQRPDVQQFHALLESERARVTAAKGLFNPRVTVSGSWGYDRSSNLHYGNQDQSSAAAVEFRWDLYTGGARQAGVRAAEAGLAEARANLNRITLKVQSDVHSAVIAITDAQERIRLQRETLTTARENRRLVRAAYVAGHEPLTRLNEAQRDFINADAALALARIRLRQAWSDLYAAAFAYRDAASDQAGG